MSKLDSINAADLSSNPRATLAAWLKYEPIVAKALQVHPKPFAYTPTTMSPYSVASKLRDAVRGKIAFDYPSTLHTDVVSRWWNEVQVSNDIEKVLIGPKGVKVGRLDGSVHSDYAFMFDTLEYEEVSAFELLLSTGRIKGPVMIQHPKANLSVDGTQPNCERIFRPDGALILL